MANVTLTEARVKALQPRKTVRDVRDGKLRGFGVRVLPSGRKRFFIHCQFRGERVWKIVGDAGSISVAEARSMAAEMLAAIRWRRISEEVRRAEGRFCNGDHHGCVPVCRAIVEEPGCELFGRKTWAEPLLGRLSSNRREIPKNERDAAPDSGPASRARAISCCNDCASIPPQAVESGSSGGVSSARPPLWRYPTETRKQG